MQCWRKNMTWKERGRKENRTNRTKYNEARKKKRAKERVRNPLHALVTRSTHTCDSGAQAQRLEHSHDECSASGCPTANEHAGASETPLRPLPVFARALAAELYPHAQQPSTIEWREAALDSREVVLGAQVARQQAKEKELAQERAAIDILKEHLSVVQTRIAADARRQAAADEPAFKVCRGRKTLWARELATMQPPPPR